MSPISPFAQPATAPRRPKVLLLAYACRPGAGSEAGVGWNRAIETAKHCDTWVICEQHWSERPIREHVEREGQISGLTFVFVPKSRFERAITRLGFLYYVAYNGWQRRAAEVGRRLHHDIGFDLIHQTTLCGYREPGYLWTLDVPFVWGPVGGTQNVPWRFLASLGPTAAAREGIRSLTNFLQLQFGRRIRRAARRAAVVLAANSTVQRDLRRAMRIAPRRMLETGLPARPGRPRLGASGRALRILWSGDHEPFKALPLLLKALASLPSHESFELRVLGEGPTSTAWRRLAASLGIDHRIEWVGRIAHPDALAHNHWADVLVFTSLRDTSGNVVLEAMQAGAPVICLDHQGAQNMVNESCGIRVPVSTPARVVSDIALALSDLHEKPAMLARLSRGALGRAASYLWSTQVGLTMAIYRSVLDTAPADRLASDRPCDENAA